LKWFFNERIISYIEYICKSVTGGSTVSVLFSLDASRYYSYMGS